MPAIVSIHPIGAVPADTPGATQGYQHFTTLAAAQAYCDAQTALMNLPSGGVTNAWAQPTLLADGSYVVQSYQDATAVAWSAAWVLPAAAVD